MGMSERWLSKQKSVQVHEPTCPSAVRTHASYFVSSSNSVSGRVLPLFSRGERMRSNRIGRNYLVSNAFPAFMFSDGFKSLLQLFPRNGQDRIKNRELERFPANRAAEGGRSDLGGRVVGVQEVFAKNHSSVDRHVPLRC